MCLEAPTIHAHVPAMKLSDATVIIFPAVATGWDLLPLFRTLHSGLVC